MKKSTCTFAGPYCWLLDIAVNLSMVFSQLTLAGSKYQNETLKILNEQFGCRPTPIHSDILKGIFEKEQ